MEQNSTDKVNAALTIEGAAAGGGNGGAGTDLSAELEKAKHSSSVWAGRAKSLSDENAKLKDKIRQLEAGKAVDDTLAQIPESVKGDTPDEYTRAALDGAKRMVDETSERLEKKIDEMGKAQIERDHQMFLSQIGLKHSKFFDSVGPGGDKESMWRQFKSANFETYNAVIASNDVARFDNLVRQFCAQIGVNYPSGGHGGPAAPDPSPSTGGSQPTGPTDPDGQKKYTTDEYLKLLEQAEDARNNGDMTTYRNMTATLTKALNEGRVG